MGSHPESELGSSECNEHYRCFVLFASLGIFAINAAADKLSAWSTIWSVYPSFPYFGNGLMYAFSPWSGHYTGVPPNSTVMKFTPCPTCVCSQSDYLDYRAHHSGASSFPRLITLLPPSICHLFARVHSRAPSLAVCFAGLAIFGELRTRDFASWRLMGRIRALSRQFWRCHGAISFSCSTKQQEVRL